VDRLVIRALAAFPHLSANTYEGHPWPGWDHLSVDFWDKRGRGWPLSREDGFKLRRWIRRNSLTPPMRHDIYLHELWTSFGGESHWAPDDHSGRLRHYHVTFWP